MHSLFGTARGSNPGPFDSKSDTLTTTPPPPTVCVVCPSLCTSVSHANESEIDLWLLWNSDRNPGFPIQNLPSDSQSEVRFRHFGCFRVGTLPMTRLCQWSTGSTHRSVCRLAKILYDHVQEGPVVKALVEFGTESIIPPPEACFESSFGGISPPTIKISSPNLVRK